jgi:hypothetical protein
MAGAHNIDTPCYVAAKSEDPAVHDTQVNDAHFHRIAYSLLTTTGRACEPSFDQAVSSSKRIGRDLLHWMSIGYRHLYRPY